MPVATTIEDSKKISNGNEDGEKVTIKKTNVLSEKKYCLFVLLLRNRQKQQLGSSMVLIIINNNDSSNYIYNKEDKNK